MKSRTTRAFWRRFADLPPGVKEAATRQFRLWLADHNHPSTRFKKVGNYWSVRVAEGYRALGLLHGDTIVWVWIGDHDDYEDLLD